MIEPLLTIPEFKSKVPENARRILDEDSRWLADTLSILDQRNEWMCQRLVETYNRSLNAETQITIWKSKFETPLAAIVAIIAILMPTLLSWALKKFIP